MAQYNFFISYSHKDRELLEQVSALLKERGYSVFSDMELMMGVEWAEAIAEAIANSDCFIPMITDAFLTSASTQHELRYASQLSKGRAQSIFPLYFTTRDLPASMEIVLGTYQSFFIRKPEDLQAAIEIIDKFFGYKIKSATLYEKLAEYRSLKHAAKETDTVCRLLNLICSQWPHMTTAEKKLACPEICKLLDPLSCYPGEYGSEAKALSRSVLSAASNAAGLLQSIKESFSEDVFFCAFAVQIKYWQHEVSINGVDMMTSGDVFQGIINPFPIQKAIQDQAPYVQAFEAALAKATPNMEADFTAEEIDFIKQTPNFILSREETGSTPSRSYGAPASALSEDEEILLSVAKFMQEGNRLFDALQKRGIAGDFLKCLLTSYERLKNYCQIVGATDVAADCVDRIVEIRDQLTRQVSKPTENEKAENGIKSLLGFTLNSSGNYDVFISFKNEDSDLAEKVYQLCQRHMKVPFWSKRTLPELSKSEYEDAIYAALRKSKHFVVVLSRLEFLEANWIQREMKAFDRAITEGRKPGGNFIFVATDSVYDEILRCNKMCLDERYCGYQILKMSEYEKTLMQYIT